VPLEQFTTIQISENLLTFLIKVLPLL